MTFYTNTFPTARAEHRCEDCGRTIRRGERYRRGFGADGGTAWTWKECEHCHWLIQIIEWYPWEGYGPETFIDWEPETLARLRLKALWRKRWTCADGSLYPVPTITTLEDEFGFTRVIDLEAAS